MPPKPRVGRKGKLTYIKREARANRPRFLRPLPKQLPRTPSVVREEWRARTIWPQRERWHSIRNLMIRETHQSRLKEHYHTTLADDLMYMHYIHEVNPRAPTRVTRGLYDAEDPYTRNRFNPLAGGDRFTRKRLPPTTVENVLRLERIVLHSFQKEAIGNRSQLLGVIAAFRALSGESGKQAGGRHTAKGVQIVRGRKTVHGWIRPRVPCGVKVELRGDKMYDFLGTFVEFVIPRLREFGGFQMEPPSKNPHRQSAVSGVVSVGLNPLAMALFPQIEVNVDAYHRMYGFHITFITNAQGQGAQNLARALVSGFGVPFQRA